jgi:hypothetical protein
MTTVRLKHPYTKLDRKKFVRSFVNNKPDCLSGKTTCLSLIWELCYKNITDV